MAEQRRPHRRPDNAGLGSEGDSVATRGFPPTDWGLVLSAGADSRPALERLCRVYWGPAYAFVRRVGYERGAALELLQEFFAAIVQQNVFSRAGADKQPFRLWLLTELEDFLVRRIDGRRQPARAARGVALDANVADALDGSEDAALGPRGAYERVLALSVMERAFARLEREQAERGQTQRFRALQPWLVPAPSPDELASLEQALGLGRTSVNLALHALRNRLGAFVQHEIANLLERRDDTEGLKAEMDALLGALHPADERSRPGEPPPTC